jgi:hypothetical protein
MSLYAKPAHTAVSLSVGYALTTVNAKGWACFTAVSLLRLSDLDRVALVCAALQALHADHEVPTIEAALGWESS